MVTATGEALEDSAVEVRVYVKVNSMNYAWKTRVV